MRTPAYLWLLLAGFAFSAFSGQSGYIGLPLSLDRPLFLLAFVLLILDEDRPSLRSRAVWWAAGALVVLVLVSWIATGSLLDSAKGFALFDRVVAPVAMLAAGALAVTTAEARDLVLKALTAMGFYVAAVGLLAYAGVTSLVFPRYIADVTLGIQNDRARGPFLASEPYGMVCAIALFASIALMGRRPGRVWLGLATTTALVSTVGVLLCLTRSVWLATGLAIVVVGLMTRRTRRLLPGLAVVVVAGVSLVLAAFPTVLTAAADRLGTQSSLYDRQNTNAAAWRILEAEPLTGIGWGNFTAQSSQWVRQADLYPLTNTNIEIHNVFLSRGAELGVAGAALWLFVVLLGPVSAVVRARSLDVSAQDFRLLALACGFVWLIPTLLSPNPYPMPNFIVWFIAGIAGSRWLVEPPLEALARPRSEPSPLSRKSS